MPGLPCIEVHAAPAESRRKRTGWLCLTHSGRKAIPPICISPELWRTFATRWPRLIPPSSHSNKYYRTGDDCPVAPPTWLTEAKQSTDEPRVPAFESD